MTPQSWILPKPFNSVTNQINPIESRRNFMSLVAKGLLSAALLPYYVKTAKANNLPARSSAAATCADAYEALTKQICDPSSDLDWISEQYKTAGYYDINLGNDSHSRFSVPIRFKFSSRVISLGNGRYMRIDEGVPFIDINASPRNSKDVNLSEALRISLIGEMYGVLITPCGWRLFPNQKDIDQLTEELKSFEPVEGRKTTIRDVNVHYVRPHFDGDKWKKSFGITNNVTGNPFKNFIVSQIPMDKDDFNRQKAFDTQKMLNT